MQENGPKEVWKMYTDGYKFYCTKCKHLSNIWARSFFEYHRTELSDIVKVIYFWSTGVQAFICCRFLPHLNRKMVNDWYSFCRDICIKHFNDNPVQFNNGDVTSEIQIDESIFGKKRKYHRGKNFMHFWIFGLSNPKQHDLSLTWGLKSMTLSSAVVELVKLI